uniref:Synaptic plasticity regulator PANTS n=1 Tax=Culicoides sonorensis TaxID=179676 RepID=A0A336K5Q7_CULSO
MPTAATPEAPFTPELPETWSIRPCEVYYDEYKDCKSIKGRFQQYFVNGESDDCTPWKRDYDNCVKFEDSRDLKAARALIESEKKRRYERFKGHYGNDVWQKRKQPPENWNSKLPEAISKEYETSYLAQKARELRGEIPEMPDVAQNNYCVIM